MLARGLLHISNVTEQTLPTDINVEYRGSLHIRSNFGPHRINSSNLFVFVHAP